MALTLIENRALNDAATRRSKPTTTATAAATASAARNPSRARRTSRWRKACPQASRPASAPT